MISSKNDRSPTELINLAIQDITSDPATANRVIKAVNEIKRDLRGLAFSSSIKLNLLIHSIYMLGRLDARERGEADDN